MTVYILGPRSEQTMPDSMDPRRKRLRFRCHHMGTAENDHLFGRFADSHIADLDEDQLVRLECLLEENDNDLFLWVTGKEPVPGHLDTDVMRLIQDINKSA